MIHLACAWVTGHWRNYYAVRPEKRYATIYVISIYTANFDDAIYSQFRVIRAGDFALSALALLAIFSTEV